MGFQNKTNYCILSLVGCHLGDSQRNACNNTGNFVVKRFFTSNVFGFFITYKRLTENIKQFRNITTKF